MVFLFEMMRLGNADHRLLSKLIDGKNGTLIKYKQKNPLAIAIPEGFCAMGRIFISGGKTLHLFCGAEIRTSAIRHIVNVTQDDSGITVLIETMSSIYQVRVQR